MEFFTFGKYKGKNIMDIIKNDPKYVHWCVRNVEWFELTVEQCHELSKQMIAVMERESARRRKWENSMYCDDEPYDGWGEDMRACFDPNY